MVADPSDDEIRCHARDVVELVRVETGLTHANSRSVVHTVLQYVCTHLHRLDRNAPALLDALPLATTPPEGAGAIADSADAKAMVALFEQLTQCKEDDQQRNWMLYEDEGTIGDLLQSLSNGLQNCDRQISIYVMSKFKYFYIHSLVEYFQMETRWSLRRLLIENFMLMCSIDQPVISLFLNSVLPLELAQVRNL